MSLTPKRQKVLRFVSRYWEKHNRGPTLREIGKHLGVCKVTALQHVRALQREGFVTRQRYGTRSIQVNDPPVPPAWGSIPVKGTVAAGSPIEAIEEEELVRLPEIFDSGGKTFLLRISGDALASESIQDGDFVVVDAGKAPVDGEMVVVSLKNRGTALGRFRNDRKSIRLNLSGSRRRSVGADKAEVQGVVVGVIRKY